MLASSRLLFCFYYLLILFITYRHIKNFLPSVLHFGGGCFASLGMAITVVGEESTLMIVSWYGGVAAAFVESNGGHVMEAFVCQWRRRKRRQCAGEAGGGE